MTTRLALSSLKQTKSKTAHKIIPIDENIARDTNHRKVHRHVSRGKFKGVLDTRSDKCICLSCRLTPFSTCKFCKTIPYVSSALRREYNYTATQPAHCQPIPSRPKDVNNWMKRDSGDNKEKARTLFEAQVQKLSRSPTLSRAKEQLNRITIRMREASNGVLERGLSGQQQSWQ